MKRLIEVSNAWDEEGDHSRKHMYKHKQNNMCENGLRIMANSNDLKGFQTLETSFL